MTEQQAKILLESLKDLQKNPVKNGIPFPCPRCGHYTMKPETAANALSRYQDVYICSGCGQDEAVRDFQGMQPLPLMEWGMVQGLSA